MFTNLSRRIVFFTVLSVLICSAALSLFSYTWMRHTLRDQFKQVALSYFQSSSDNLSQYLHYTEETSKWVTNNPTVSLSLNKPEYVKETTNILDKMVYNISPEIKGLVIYKNNGDIYTLSRLSNVPSLSQLIEHAGIKDFTQSPQKKYIWTFRYKHVSSFYNHDYGKNGMFSYILKLTNDSLQPLGYAVVDLDPDTLFRFFHTENDMFQNQGVFIVLNDEDILVSPYNHADNDRLSSTDLNEIRNVDHGHFISIDGDRLMMYATVMDSNTKIVMSVPLQNAYSYSSIYVVLIVLSAFLFTLLAFYIAIRLRRSIIEPLTRLYDKITAFKLK